MVRVIYIIASLFLCLGIVIFYLSFIARKRAVEEQAKIFRVFDEAKRALGLIQSDDPEKILIGLQLLSVYDIPRIRIKAFQRLMQLTHHNNRQIAQLAEHIIDLSQSAEIPEQRLVGKAV